MGRLLIETDIGMQTRDGVRLAADVYRLDDDERRPVLLLRTPYNRADPFFISGIVVDPTWLARNGYVVVVQDVRGRFGSEGVHDFFVAEQDDGYDTVEWAAEQPWSNGRVGIYGSSYHGMTALAAVAAQPPHLEAAMALVGTPAVAPILRPGGVLELGFFAMYCLAFLSPDIIMRSDATPEEQAELFGQLQAAVADPIGYVTRLPIAGLPVLCDRRAMPWWSDWMSADPDDPRWQTDTLAHDPGRVSVPLLQVAGFMDFLSPPMIALHEKIQDDPRNALVIGPWSHFGTYNGHVGGLDVSGTAGGGPSTLGPMVKAWFDHWLRDDEAEAASGVRYFSTGDLQWRTSEQWPPPAAPIVLNLSGDGSGSDGRLGDATSAGGPDHFRYDPLDPVPTCGGAISMAALNLGPDGIQDQTAVAARPDVLVYTGDVLDEPLQIAGTGTVELSWETNVEDTDVIVTLVDVGVDGIGRNVGEGALRARYRNGGHEAWLVPGDITTLSVTLHPIAHTFQIGHRVRLMVTSSSFPRFSRNLNARVLPEFGTEADIVVADQVVHHDADHPSRLILPQALSSTPDAN